MKWKIILFILTLNVVFSACEEQDIPLFTTDDTGIYFQRVSSYRGTTEYYADTISYSFVSSSAMLQDTVLQATVRTMGKVADYDRPFKVVVNQEGTTAVEGVHYELDLDSIIMPAGTSTAFVRVRFFRTKDMMEKAVRLALQLEDNEYFKCYLSEYKNTNVYEVEGKIISGNLFAFSLSEMYTEPSYWSMFGGNFFGGWTAKKYIVVNSVCGLTLEDWDDAGLTGAKVSYGRFGFFAAAVQKYLQEQADAGTPELDSDGGYMQLAPSYSVDYSLYK